MRTVFNFTARDRVPFTHRGKEESEGWRARVSSFPGLKARPFELSLSLSLSPGFSTGISASRSTIPEMHTNATALRV